MDEENGAVPKASDSPDATVSSAYTLGNRRLVLVPRSIAEPPNAQIVLQSSKGYLLTAPMNIRL
jgi:hypothetical protein